jgi:hypothetical protein
MAWDFATEPEFEAQLSRMRGLVRDEIIPLETLDIDYATFGRITAPAQTRTSHTEWRLRRGSTLCDDAAGSAKST